MLGEPTFPCSPDQSEMGSRKKARWMDNSMLDHGLGPSSRPEGRYKHRPVGWASSGTSNVHLLPATGCLVSDPLYLNKVINNLLNRCEPTALSMGLSDIHTISFYTFLNRVPGSTEQVQPLVICCISYIPFFQAPESRPSRRALNCVATRLEE